MQRLILATGPLLGWTTPGLATGQFDGEWVGEFIAPGQRADYCGFDKWPVRALRWPGKGKAMGRRLLAAALLLVLPLPASGAGWFDGAWTGEIISTRASRTTCGFDKNPIVAHVDNRRIRVTLRDARAERTFEGDLGDDLKLRIWVPWAIAGESAKANLSVRFSSTGIEGKLYANVGDRSCEARIFLWRRPGSPAAWNRDLVKAARAGQRSAAQLAIEHGADPNVEDHEGTTPLIAAAAGGHADAVKFLLAAGADRARKNKHGLDAAAVAKKYGRTVVVDLLNDLRPAAVAENTLKRQEKEARRAEVERQRKEQEAQTAARLQAEAERQRVVEELAALKAKAEKRRKGEEARRLAEAEKKRKEEEARRLAAAERKRKFEQTVVEGKAIEDSLRDVERKYVQWGLKELGFYDGGIDGSIGVGTRRAIKGYQKNLEALETGYLNQDQFVQIVQAGRPLYEAEEARLLAEAERKRNQEETRRLTEAERKRKEEEARRLAEAERKRTEVAEFKSVGIGEELKKQLALLKNLKASGILDEREYESKKSALINRFFGFKQTASNVDAAQLANFAGVKFGNYHALVIGNNDYKHLPDLKTAVNDAETIARLLKDEYGFDVSLLTNADRNQILDALDIYREELGEFDNLLIYYAGHGWLDESAGQGYWLPVDAKKNRRSGWISNAAISATMRALDAKHVMVVADSCYSGTLIRGLRVPDRTADYIQRMAIKRARVVMTSGGLEPVADLGGSGHSPFAKAFLDVLGENRSVMDGTTMFSLLRRLVMLSADQTPEYSDARKAGHDGGDFLFVRKKQSTP